MVVLDQSHRIVTHIASTCVFASGIRFESSKRGIFPRNRFPAMRKAFIFPEGGVILPRGHAGPRPPHLTVHNKCGWKLSWRPEERFGNYGRLLHEGINWDQNRYKMIRWDIIHRYRFLDGKTRNGIKRPGGYHVPYNGRGMG